LIVALALVKGGWKRKGVIGDADPDGVIPAGSARSGQAGGAVTVHPDLRAALEVLRGRRQQAFFQCGWATIRT